MKACSRVAKRAWQHRCRRNALRNARAHARTGDLIGFRSRGAIRANTARLLRSSARDQKGAMKVQLFIPATMLASVALVAVIRFRETVRQKESKLFSFEEIKLRVASDVLREYMGEIHEVEDTMNKVKSEAQRMEEEMNPYREASEKAKEKLVACQNEKVRKSSFKINRKTIMHAGGSRKREDWQRKQESNTMLVLNRKCC